MEPVNEKNCRGRAENNNKVKVMGATDATVGAENKRDTEVRWHRRGESWRQ